MANALTSGRTANNGTSGSTGGKKSSNRWDLSNWTEGPVTLFQALGIKANIKYPDIQPQLSQHVAAEQSSSQQQGSTPAGKPSGNIPTGALSYGQLEQLWINAGGNPAKAAIAAAIAMAESGGRQNAKNVNTNGSIDRGYWQINSSHGSLSTFDALGNARAAISISNNGANWGPWVTYNSGAYRQYLQSGPAPKQPAPSPAPGG